MKEELLTYIKERTEKLEGLQYERNQAQAFIIGGQLDELKELKKKIEQI